MKATLSLLRNAGIEAILIDDIHQQVGDSDMTKLPLAALVHVGASLGRAHNQESRNFAQMK